MKRAVVVGAGLAGLSAAVDLSSRGYQVTVIEYLSKPGGRVRQINAPYNGKAIDWGQHLMLGCYHESKALLNQLGTLDKLCLVSGTTPFLSGPKQIHPFRISKLPAPFHTLPGVFALTHLKLGERLGLARAVIDAKREVRESPGKLDLFSAADWLRKKGQKPSAINGFWEPLSVATLNLPASQASAFLLATVLDKGFFAGREDAQPMLPSTTLHDLFIAPMVEALKSKGGTVIYNTKVAALVENCKGLVQTVCTNTGRIIEGDVIVLAVPSWRLPPLVAGLPRLDSLKQRAKALSFSPIVTLDLWFDRQWMPYAYAGLLGSPVHWLFNHHAGQSNGSKTAVYRVSAVVSHAKAQIDLDGRDLVEMCLSEIQRFFPKAKAATLVGHLVTKAQKATISARPGQRSLRPGTKTPYPNLFISGDWTNTDLPATIESAVVSGKRAAAYAARFKI